MVCLKGYSSTGFSLFGLREVIPDQTGVEQWKELLLNTGGTHLTLQDPKLPEGCTSGGFCYTDRNSVITRNRFITWKVSNDILELVEHSLDLNLQGNFLRVRFQGLAILEGTSIHETKNNVVILVSTISSVHRLLLPHPLKHNDVSMLSGTNPVPSIFTEASIAWLRDSASFRLTSGTNPSTAANVALPLTAASCLVGANSHDALFALANTSFITLIRMGMNASAITTSTLQPSSNLTRLLTGYLPNVLRGGSGSGGSDNEDTTAGLALLPTVGGDVLVAALSKGLKLRLWSATTNELKTDFDLIECIGDKTVKQFGSLHRLRWCPDQNGFGVAVFSSFGKSRSFLLLNLDFSSLRFHFNSSVTAQQQNSHLIDFSLTSEHLYALWSTVRGEYLLEFTSEKQWQSVVLEQGIDSENGIEYDESTTDAKQAYLEAIFEPGKFSLATLSLALQAFERSSGRKRNGSLAQLGIAAIRELVVAAIEEEVREQLNDDSDITEEEYLQLMSKSWTQFYAYVVQYHQKRPIPVGLLIDEATGLHVMLKRGMISLLRPLDLVESLLLQRGKRWDESPYNHIPLLAQQPVSSGLVALLEVLFLVSDNLSMEQIKRFDQCMFELQSADQIAHTLANELLEDDSSKLLDAMQMALSSVDVCLALSALLQQLGVSMRGGQECKSIDTDQSPSFRFGGGGTHFNFLFAGALGLGALSESARQMADLRLAVCRDVLIVQQLLISAKKKLQLSADDAESIRSEFVPQTVPLTHAYYALSWLCHHSSQQLSSSLCERNLRVMAVLGFTKSLESFLNSPCKRLVELFLSLEGGSVVRSLVLQDEDVSDVQSSWLDGFPLFMKAVGQLLWPIGNHTTFMEFLMERFQPSAIQGYVRLQQNWCEWNTCSRKFLMSVALVATGEGDKASRWMLEAAEGIAREDLLVHLVTRHDPSSSQAEMAMRFHLICVKLLQQAGLSSAALRVALKALNSGTNDDDPLLPTMWSIVGKLHLHLAHYQEAYEAIISNPDSSQRPESLGRLVNTLLERKRMDILLTFPYSGLESELEKIVERRARASDVLSMKVYYSFLYAFHVRQGKMRKAAAVMHEQALRYGCEGESPKMVKCLLACLNALRLVSREEAWLVKPILSTGGTQADQRTVEVIEYADIEKEYELCYACLNLGQAIASLSPSDVVTLLTSRNHYESALRVAKIFNVQDTSSVVEHLAANCVSLSRELVSEDDAWVWLAENQSTGVGKASEQCWRLLERLLVKAENIGAGCKDSKLTRCHRAAARKILSLDCTLPHWLAASYKMRNAGELISVYHQAGLLEDAAQVTLELVDAMLGQGKEYFGSSSKPLEVGSPVWLPYTVLDRLLLELDAHANADDSYRRLSEEIKGKMETYFELAERTTRCTILN